MGKDEQILERQTAPHTPIPLEGDVIKVSHTQRAWCQSWGKPAWTVGLWNGLRKRNPKWVSAYKLEK